MKVFDVIGGLVVLGWLALVINVGWKAYAPESTISVKAQEVQLVEGESWMILRRADEEIGFVHETRTSLGADWLFEYELFVSVKPLGAVRSTIKSTMGPDGTIRKVNASTHVAKKKISLDAKVEGNKVVLTSNLDQMNRTLNLKKAPKLSTHVYRALAMADEFEPGDVYKEDFFDATSLGMNQLVFEFIGTTTVQVYGEKIQARHFRQRVSGNELDVYIDNEGQVVIQEFPFEIIATRVTPTLGKARAWAMRNVKKEDRKGIDLELGSAFFNQTTPSRFLISGISENDDLSLASHSQTLIEWTKEGAVIDTASMNSLTTLSPEEEALALAATTRIDFNDKAFTLGKNASGTKQSASGMAVVPIARSIVRKVYDKMKVSSVVAPLPASVIWSSGEGDCTEFSLVSVAALRRSGLPARFVYGVKADGAGKFVSHQWIEFWDGKRFMELDPTEKSGEVQPNTIRFFSSLLPESPRILNLLGRVKVNPYKPDLQNSKGQSADFN